MTRYQIIELIVNDGKTEIRNETIKASKPSIGLAAKFGLPLDQVCFVEETNGFLEFKYYEGDLSRTFFLRRISND